MICRPEYCDVLVRAGPGLGFNHSSEWYSRWGHTSWYWTTRTNLSMTWLILGLFLYLWMSAELLYKAGICIEVWLILIPTFLLWRLCLTPTEVWLQWWMEISGCSGQARSDRRERNRFSLFSFKNPLQVVRWREQSALITLCLFSGVRLVQVAQSSNQQNFYSQLKATNPSCLGGKNSPRECKYYQRQQSTSHTWDVKQEKIQSS